jgi:hypothetical protein
LGSKCVLNPHNMRKQTIKTFVCDLLMFGCQRDFMVGEEALTKGLSKKSTYWESYHVLSVIIIITFVSIIELSDSWAICCKWGSKKNGCQSRLMTFCRNLPVCSKILNYIHALNIMHHLVKSLFTFENEPKTIWFTNVD